MCVLEAFQHSAAYLLQNANEEAGDWQGGMGSDILCMDDLLLVGTQAIRSGGQRFSYHVVVHQPKCGLSNRHVSCVLRSNPAPVSVPVSYSYSNLSSPSSYLLIASAIENNDINDFARCFLHGLPCDDIFSRITFKVKFVVQRL